MSKFSLKQTPAGFSFNLVADNGQVVAASQVYAAKDNCLKGIGSVQTNAPLAPVEDQTVKDFEAEENPKFEVYSDKAGKFRFRLKAENGEIIAVSQGAESNLVTTTKGIDTSKSGLLTVDEDGHTSRPGVFAAGDAASGARTVVEAVANGKRVAEAMHEYMQSLPMPVTTDYPDVPVEEHAEASAQAEQVL